MDTLAIILSSIGVSASLLSLLWIYRRNKTLKSPYGLFGLIASVFTIYHFSFVCGAENVFTFHELMMGVYILISVAMNAYCSGFSKINIGVNRRKARSGNYTAKDRRKQPTNPVIE